MDFFEMLSYFLFPPKCGICDKINKNYICGNCYRKLNSKCEIDRYNNKYFEKHIYLFQYKGIIREKIIDYKFNDKPYLYNFFSQIIIKNEKICRFLKSYDIIIPIPMHNKKKRIRGYNQTELIAKELASFSQKINYEKDILIKVKNTNSQRLLNRNQRKNNLKDSYSIKNVDEIKNKKILLFDDVFTTGSTANECSKVLKNAGAYRIDILTIAKD